MSRPSQYRLSALPKTSALTTFKYSCFWKGVIHRQPTPVQAGLIINMVGRPEIPEFDWQIKRLVWAYDALPQIFSRSNYS